MSRFFIFKNRSNLIEINLFKLEVEICKSIIYKIW